MTGGFILGFDSDHDDIFEQQIRFIERGAIPWAMLNFLQAVPLTALHDRMKKEDRLIEYSVQNSDCDPPNFRTVLPASVLVRGFMKTLSSIYDPKNFFERALRSLEDWQTGDSQHPAREPGLGGIIKILFRSFWQQGLRSSYKREYWKYLLRLMTRYPLNQTKLWLGFTILISAHHFIPYAQQVVRSAAGAVFETAGEPELVATGQMPS